jgi:exonuclease VII small subunit
MRRIKVVSIGLILMLVLSSVFTLMPAYPVSAGSEERGVPERVANIIINKISTRIDAVLALADEYGITIPDNLTIYIDKARSILANASELVEESPLEAIKTAVRASGVFAPVAKYVLSNLPEEAKHELVEDRLETAVEVKLKMVASLENTIEWLENRSITVPDDIKTMVSDARSLLEEAQSLLESGEYEESDVAHLIAEASKLIGQATAALHKFARKGWILATFADKAVIGMFYASQKVTIVLNRTINVLEDGDVDAAKDRLTDIINITDRLIEFMNRAIDMSGNYSEMGGNFTSALIILRDALVEARNYMLLALDALENDDVLTAVSYLEQAIDTINNTLSSVMPIFRGMHHYLKAVTSMFEKMKNRFREAMENMFIHRLAKLVAGLETMEFRLKRAYKLYNQGIISGEKFLDMLNNAENVLTKILDNLNEMKNPPPMLVEKINNMLSWIEQVKAEISS